MQESDTLKIVSIRTRTPAQREHYAAGYDAAVALVLAMWEEGRTNTQAAATLKHRTAGFDSALNYVLSEWATGTPIARVRQVVASIQRTRDDLGSPVLKGKNNAKK